MTVTVLASLSGSPGVTTVATALGVHWNRPALVIEADAANATSLLPGFLRSNLDPRYVGNLDKVVTAHSRGILGWSDLVDPEAGLSIAIHDLPPIPSNPIPAVPAQHRLWMIPGFVQIGMAGGVRSFWNILPRLLRSLSESGVDVLIDLGRLDRDDVRQEILDAADHVLFIASTTLTDANRIYRRLEQPDLRDRIDGGGRDRHRLILVETRHSYVDPADFAKITLPVLATVPFDPDGAAVFTYGRPDNKPNANRYRRAIQNVVAAAAHLPRTLDREATA